MRWYPLVAVVLLILAACTSTQSPASPTTLPITLPSTSSTSAPRVATTEPSSVTTSTVSLTGRGCASKISLTDIDEMHTEYVERSIRVGPVLFGNAATFGEISVEHLDPSPSGFYPAIKMPLTVVAGEAVTVEIAPTSLTWASLLYDRGAFQGIYHELAEGAQAVRFTACDEGDTSFNGGVIVTSPGCLELLVTDADQSLRVIIAIGPVEC